ncbi:MAG: MotA/TolQ/ExbB proton channel family protein [Methylobacterium sp.]|jgi:TolQ protein|uniref:MotA/TolQ/ExbB proton channel family protein n=1 Tax=unclassified Methylobacterium TaxID=2615210 RepID=UPI0006F67E15|nr:MULTISPECIES: MotA/TolQ/ExbB proton channel family protein [unclassified Methylobacterium]KQP10729.1 flagellar motor protein MotA [Methylobacterium sp. Leaf99]MDO9426303.1 MotA/TolQ/ExbB proton channel family protein [Methylobacterium sp.]TXM77842.1 flagellar motor protein MotA [Methylobacterium sp. WL69]
MDPTAAPAGVSHDMSFLGLFLQADPIVKSVMILLVVASIACWTVVFEKIIRIAAAKRQAKAFDTLVRSGGSLESSGKGMDAQITAAAIEAWRDQDSTETRAERRDRIERAMRAALTTRLKSMQTGLPLLATSGSTAPFIGLFGTVWGIMNSFSSIAKSQDTSLAVVAPGIAEALFATAIGLVVAIPAVMAYNKLINDIGRVQASFVTSIGTLGNRLARDRAVHGRAAAAAE